MDELAALVRSCLEHPRDYRRRRDLADWLGGKVRQQPPDDSSGCWPGEAGGRCYWWRETVTRLAAAPSARLRSRVYDRLPGGPRKDAEFSFYDTHLAAFRALAVALCGGREQV